MRWRTREALLLVALVLVGAGTTYAVFRPASRPTPAADDRNSMAPRDFRGTPPPDGPGPSSSVPPATTGAATPSATGRRPSPAPGGDPASPAGGGGQTQTTPVAAPTTTPVTQPPPPATITVPYVIGLGEGYAVSEINSAGFVAQVSYQHRQNSCSVLEQTPAGNSQAEPGTYVYITVAMGDAPCADA